ncbi:MAG: ATP-binding protein [Robiginitalea sp.]|nr:ATP-binding protein [Robiginitalea sp.]
MPITSKDLLDQLADLQLTLEGYSFEQLNVEEARALKSYFDTFRNHLEEKIWNPRAGIPTTASEEVVTSSGDTPGMIASVSHDLRNPLNAILGFADLLSATDLDTDQQQYLQAIRVASQSSLETIGELLQFSRLKAGPETPVSIAFRPLDLLREVRLYTRASLGEAPVAFELFVEGSLPEALVGDPSKLRRILMNLLENAIEYTEKGTIALVVRATSLKEGVALEFEVSDTGSGIPRAELPYIFKPYYQAGMDRKASRAGHGLGLSIVSKLVGEQKGSIEVKSEEGKGTTFQFRIPFALKRSEEPRGLAETPGTGTGGELNGSSILVFEDNPLNQKLLESRLQKWGCTVFTASRVPDGLRLLKREAIDLVLMDLRMPLMDGYQATRRIREHSSASVRRIPVIALTADISAADGEAFRRSGIDDLLLKPYEPESLRATLTHWIRRSANRKDVREFRCEPLPELSAAPGLISLDYLEGECMGDRRMLADLVQLFRNNLLEFAGRMKFHLKEGDLRAIQASTHKVQSGLKLIGAVQLLKSVEAIDRAATEFKDIVQAARAYEEFLDLYPLVEEALQREMDKRN